MAAPAAPRVLSLEPLHELEPQRALHRSRVPRPIRAWFNKLHPEGCIQLLYYGITTKFSRSQLSSHPSTFAESSKPAASRQAGLRASPTIPTAQHGTRRVIRSREARRKGVAVEPRRPLRRLSFEHPRAHLAARLVQRLLVAARVHLHRALRVPRFRSKPLRAINLRAIPTPKNVIWARITFLGVGIPGVGIPG